MEKKSFLATEVFALLLGFLGVHRYYTGYIGLGILQTLTLGGCGIWSLIDFIFISLGQYKDAKGQELEGYNKNIGMGALILVLILTIFCMFGPKSKSHTSVINNYSTNSNTKREVIFESAKCTVDASGYFCDGNLTENDKIKLQEIQNELK